jgi:AraC-like DNA-binding protein
MLSAEKLMSVDGLAISDVVCRHGRGRGRAEEHTAGPAIVLVRRGCFVRSARGVESVLDSSVGYCINPGEEQRYDHPHDGGDDCTMISLQGSSAGLLREERDLPTGPFPVTPALDVQHRLLLSCLRRGAATDCLAERAISLAASALAAADPGRPLAARPETERARRSLANSAREILAANPETSLQQLAGLLAVSPNHLSRVFRSATGETISRHRMRLRTRLALECLAEGEGDLARLAANLGFADQSHMCRVIRSETGHSPSMLRAALIEVS